jgi:hypothetical protein
MEISPGTTVPLVRYVPGGARPGAGPRALYRDLLSEPYYSLDYRGVYLIALHNLSRAELESRPRATGMAQESSGAIPEVRPNRVFTRRSQFDQRAM